MTIKCQQAKTKKKTKLDDGGHIWIIHPVDRILILMYEFIFLFSRFVCMTIFSHKNNNEVPVCPALAYNTKIATMRGAVIY